jgi:hypothetical protein
VLQTPHARRALFNRTECGANHRPRQHIGLVGTFAVRDVRRTLTAASSPHTAPFRRTA